MDELMVQPTSKKTAKVQDTVLRENSKYRIVFHPMIVKNPNLPAAAVKGCFTFQRKGPKESWDDIPTKDLRGLKKGQGYKVDLHSEEVLKLFPLLRTLYEYYQKEGIPEGDIKLVVDQGASSSLAYFEEQLHQLLEADPDGGAAVSARLLAWAANNARDLPKLLGILEKLGPEALENLSTAVSLSVLQQGLDFWCKHQEDDNEELWQRLLAEHPLLLEQIFPWPCAIIDDKAYVGGKNVHNTGGKMVDFLVDNTLTTSVALVEIKTPKTKITGRDYRDGIPSVSWDLAGSVLQVLTYKDSLKEEYATRRGSRGGYGVFDPPCVVIIGNTQELNTDEKILTLELFRRQLKDVQVITFDELFGRVEKLIQLLKESTVAPVSEEPEFEKLPF